MPDATRHRGGWAWALGVVAGDGRHRRIRLFQWLIAGLVYAAAAGLMLSGTRTGWVRPEHVAGWSAFVTGGLAFAYVALRSGWSERLADPALTQWQIAMGIVAVCWGYLICGPVRTITLFPLLLIFAFGAFALEGRRIAWLAAFASVGVIGVTTFQRLNDSASRDLPPAATLPIDWINLLMTLVLLSALAVVAARLSALRANLNAKRDALARALAEVQRLATTDEVTGLPNRRAMIDRLAGLRRGSEAPVFCVAVIDLDHFKRINDSLGHAQGDAVLWRFAELARSVLPSTDAMARWGGEEFLLVMPDASIESACRRIDVLRRSTREIEVGRTPLTFSAGVACYRADDDISGLVLRADKAMYAAKQGGRDGVRVAD